MFFAYLCFLVFGGALLSYLIKKKIITSDKIIAFFRKALYLRKIIKIVIIFSFKIVFFIIISFLIFAFILSFLFVKGCYWSVIYLIDFINNNFFPEGKKTSPSSE